MKHQCKDCGSNQIFSDRTLGGRLVCRKCGSFNIGWNNRPLRRNSNIIKPFKSNNINPIDYQYLAIAGALIIIWISSDLLGLISKSQWMSWPGMMLNQPHRFLTNALIHMDGRHLLTNLFGIVIGRAIFMQLGMRSKYLFALLVAMLIPLSSCLQWLWEAVIASNLNAASLGSFVARRRLRLWSPAPGSYSRSDPDWVPRPSRTRAGLTLKDLAPLRVTVTDRLSVCAWVSRLAMHDRLPDFWIWSFCISLKGRTPATNYRNRYGTSESSSSR